MFVLGALATAAAAAYYLNRKQVNLGVLSIGVDYFQILAIFARSKVEWPPGLQNLFRVLSAFNFNIDLAAPDCLSPNLGFTTKFLATLGLPLAAGALFLLLHFVKVAHKLFKGQRKKLHSHLPTLVSTGITMCYVLCACAPRCVCVPVPLLFASLSLAPSRPFAFPHSAFVSVLVCPPLFLSSYLTTPFVWCCHRHRPAAGPHDDGRVQLFPSTPQHRGQVVQ